MRAENFKRIMSKVVFHASVAFRGLCKSLYGAAATGLIVLSVYGFVSVSSESGWTAVCDFIASCATFVVAFGNVYLMGSRKKGAKHG